AGIIPSLFFFLYFLQVESPHDSFCAVIFDWLSVFHGKVTDNAFYRWCMGLDQPLFHLQEIILYFLAVVFALTAYAFALQWLKKTRLKLSPYVVLLILISPLLIWAVT